MLRPASLLSTASPLLTSSPLSSTLLAFGLILVLALGAAPSLAQHPLHDGALGRDHLCHHAGTSTVGGPYSLVAQDGDEAEDEASEDSADEAQTEGEEKDEEDSWDVNDPPFDRETVEIDVTEGTWMNLDVSPDGTELVFDLLGDLYTLPIGGGDAVALTSGLAWDMQPRYSPDGEWIAFTSDRGGGDNIWLLPRNSADAEEPGEPVQVSKESFRLLNNPAWSPDGRFLAARKHFTARRSLGSGEIWLYHSSGKGASGLQLNDKPNDQKDLGEPAFSPDGRYVYFSQDTTPGAFFEYNKDSNGSIYQIRRIDLETGEIETVVSGAGGAVRPTPSPDGKYLAFVRRVRFQSVLFVRDLESGEERPLYDGLDRDLQETWAVHGVYANFAWTPDSRSLVFWAGGGLHRLDMDAASLEEIPFRVRQEHEIVPVVRYAQEVAPDKFPLKMLRWTSTSPDGSRVLYQALGKIWVKDLPEGAPRRLTSQTEHFELYPSWSRDGKSVIYVTWNDEDLGSVRSVPVAGGAGRTLTTEPGHYVEPALSPDGRQVIYRKVGGGFLTSPQHSEEQGLYVVPASGGEARLLTEDAYGAHFADASDRVYFMTYEAEDARALRSLGLDGLEPRHHAKSDAATAFQVSPDGQWLAFVERYKVHVVPFLAAAKPLQLAPGSSSVPQAAVAKHAGEYLHWSGDSQSLHWSLGAELFSRDLSQSFEFLDGAPEELPEPVAEGVAIGFDVDSARPSGQVALVGARVIPMVRDAEGNDVVWEDGVVLTEGNRIVAVGPRAEVEVPSEARVVDASGKTIIPGLIDVHWHGSQGVSEIQPQQNWYNYASLAFGVTTAHDPSNDTSTFFAASEMQRGGEIVAPRLYSTGTILYGAGGSFKAEIDSLEDARFHLQRMKAVGAFSVKSYNQPRRDQRQQVIAAAKELEMMVVPEGGSLFMHNMTQVVDGHTGIEHAIPLARLYDDVVRLWSATEVGYTPTLGVGYGGIWGENYWYATTDVWANERLLTFVPRQFVDPVARRPFKAPEEEYNHISIAQGCKQLTDAGVKVNVGAHGQREGLAVHWEMWMLEQGGMTPMEALRAGTWNGAAYLGLEGDIGSLEEGKLADLTVIDGNPLEDLRNSEKVSHVMVNGRLYEAATLDQIAPDSTPRQPFFFEKNRQPLVSAER